MNRREFLVSSAALSVWLAHGGRGLASPRGGSLVLVTADLESHVVVLSPTSGRTLARIETAPGPRSIESVDTRIAVVAHSRHGLVSIVDAAAREVRVELDGFTAPRYTAVHPNRSIAYVTDSASEEVVALDVGRGRVVSRTHVPGPARHVSVSPDGTALWTSLGSKSARLALLDLRRPSSEARAHDRSAVPRACRLRTPREARVGDIRCRAPHRSLPRRQARGRSRPRCRPRTSARRLRGRPRVRRERRRDGASTGRTAIS